MNDSEGLVSEISMLKRPKNLFNHMVTFWSQKSEGHLEASFKECHLKCSISTEKGKWWILGKVKR